MVTGLGMPRVVELMGVNSQSWSQCLGHLSLLADGERAGHCGVRCGTVRDIITDIWTHPGTGMATQELRDCFGREIWRVLVALIPSMSSEEV